MEGTIAGARSHCAVETVCDSVSCRCYAPPPKSVVNMGISAYYVGGCDVRTMHNLISSSQAAQQRLDIYVRIGTTC